MKIGLGLGLNLFGGGAATAFSPADLALSGYWKAAYAGTPWVGQSSAGSSSARNLAHATLAPAVGSTLNSLATADFNGTTHRLDGTNVMTDFISNATGSLVCLFNADTAFADTGSASIMSQPALVCETSARLTLGFTSSGVRFGCYNGSNTDSIAVAAAPGLWHLAQARYASNTIELRVDSGAWSTASRATVLSTGTIRMGASWNGGRFFDGKIALGLLSDVRESDTTFENIRTWVNTTFALSL